MTTQHGTDSAASGVFSFPESGDAEIFLTPKVIDHGAFTRYSESLQTLIREVSSSGGSLKSLSAETRALKQDADEVTAQLRTRIEATSKLLPALDQRVKAATEVLAEAAKSAALPETLKGELDSIIAGRVSEVEARAEAAVSAAEARLAAIEKRSDEAAGRVSAQADRLEAAVERATKALAATESKQATLAGAIAKVPESVDGFINGRLSALKQAVDARERAAEEQTKELDDRIAEIMDSVDARVGSMIDQLEAEFGTREERLTARLVSADEQAAEIVSGLSDFVDRSKGLPAELTEDLGSRIAELRLHLEGVEGRASALRELSGRAVELLGFDPAMGDESPIKADSLMALVQNAMEIERSIREAVEQGQNMHGQLDAERSAIGEEVLATAEKLDALGAMREALDARVQDTMAWLEHAEPAMREAIESARQEALELAAGVFLGGATGSAAGVEPMVRHDAEEAVAVDQSDADVVRQLEAASDLIGDASVGENDADDAVVMQDGADQEPESEVAAEAKTEPLREPVSETGVTRAGFLRFEPEVSSADDAQAGDMSGGTEPGEEPSESHETDGGGPDERRPGNPFRRVS